VEATLSTKSTITVGNGNNDTIFAGANSIITLGKGAVTSLFLPRRPPV
jgi:hypothetical protein